MWTLITIFYLSLFLMLCLVSLKVVEMGNGNRNRLLRFISINLDPLVGRMKDMSHFFSEEVFREVFRFLAAKFGLLAARFLISLRNFSSKLAVHLYHTSRKAESGDPAAAHPSFFIKAMLDFKEKMKEEKKENS